PGCGGAAGRAGRGLGRGARALGHAAAGEGDVAGEPADARSGGTAGAGLGRQFLAAAAPSGGAGLFAGRVSVADEPWTILRVLQHLSAGAWLRQRSHRPAVGLGGGGRDRRVRGHSPLAAAPWAAPTDAGGAAARRAALAGDRGLSPAFGPAVCGPDPARRQL